MASEGGDSPTSVFSCRSSLTNEDVVVKIFSGNMTHMAVTERTLLTLLSTYEEYSYLLSESHILQILFTHCC